MLRKAGLAATVVFSYALGTDLQYPLAVFVLIFALCLQLWKQPFRKEYNKLNWMEAMSLFVSLLTFASSPFFDSERVNNTVRVCIASVLFVGNFCLFFFFLFSLCSSSMVYLSLFLEMKGIEYDPKGGSRYILKVYVFSYLGAKIVAGFKRFFCGCLMSEAAKSAV